MIINNYCFTLINYDILRIEKSHNGSFNNKNTFFVPNKSAFLDLPFQYEDSDAFFELIVNGNKIVLNKRNRKIQLFKNDSLVLNLTNQVNSGELPSLDKTPVVFPIFDNPRIIMPEHGYSFDNDGEFITEDDVFDVYLLFCDNDFKKLRKLFIQLTGRSELVPLSAFGAWHSRYYQYNENTALQLMDRFKQENVPLDNFVIDTDWRVFDKSIGIGYEINTKLFPDMKGFFAKAHERNISIMFNDHPSPKEGTDNIFDKKEIEYRKVNLDDKFDLGLDTWWYDRNWICSLVSPSKYVSPFTLGLYAYHDITKQYFAKHANKREPQRPLIMGNVPQIVDGVYVKLLDSASHRYSIQWTGDCYSTLRDLNQEVSNIVKCGNNCSPYVHPDLGGHTGNPNKYDFVRWMQFGAFAPIYRPHSNNVVKRFREPWNYDKETTDIVREYLQIRYRLLPLIYASAFNNYESGEPIFKSPGFNYPNDNKALICQDEYMLSNKILIAPVMIDELDAFNDYASAIRYSLFNNRNLEGKPCETGEMNEINLNGQNNGQISMIFDFDIETKEDKYLYITSDDGIIVYIDGQESYWFWKAKEKMLQQIDYVFKKGEKHHITLKYFCISDNRILRLNSYPAILTNEKKTTYLPKDRWIDLNSGRHITNRKFTRNYKLDEYPLFVREGSLLPLYYSANNTNEIKYGEFVYDFYPSKYNHDTGFIYEDDFNTIGYKKGIYRKQNYRTEIFKNQIKIIFDAMLGTYKFYKTRKVLLKIHGNDELGNLKSVFINGIEYNFIRHNRKKNASMLSDSLSCKDSRSYTIKFKQDVSLKTEIVLMYE